MKPLLLAAALALLGPLAAAEPPGPQPDAWGPLTLAAEPVQPDAATPPGARIGALTFRGGLKLTAAQARFGGLSGLVVDAQDRFIAVSDAGEWVTGRLLWDADGALAGVDDPRIAPLRGLTGARLPTKEAGDAEGLARLADGRQAVSFERDHRIWLYDLAGRGPAGAAEPGPPLDAAAGRLGDNSGIEGLAFAGGLLLAGAEAGPRAPAWLLEPGATAAAGPVAAIRVSQGYRLVGLDFGPDGALYSLERHFSPVFGVRTVVRRTTAPQLGPDGPAYDGALILDLRPPQRVDNFEAIAVVPRPGGGVRLFVLSDDNFRPEQQTLLYAFDWDPPASPVP